VIIYAVCAVAGREHLLAIFNDFLALIGYWTIIWLVLVAEEQVFFRRKRGWNWEAWNDRSQLPIGIAALVAFLTGWAGAIVCMDETYYVGPIAKMVGEYGADVS
jgi:purine-cytosine permease-like protein